MNLLALSTPLGEAAFHTGLRAGAVALAATLVVGLVWRRRTGQPAPLAGLAVVAGALAGLGADGPLPESLGAAMVLLAVAGLVSDVSGRRWPGAVLAVPGAWLLAGPGLDGGPGWAPALVAAATIAGGTLVADVDRRHRRSAAAPLLLAVTVAGIYATVPDTEQALVVLGATLPLTLAAFPVPLASLGGAGSYAAAGLVAWMSASAGLHRPASIVGGVACLGLLAIEPLAARLGSAPQPAVVPCVAAHVVVVLLAARVVGMTERVADAALLGVGLGVVALLLAWAAASISGRPRES